MNTRALTHTLVALVLVAFVVSISLGRVSAGPAQPLASGPEAIYIPAPHILPSGAAAEPVRDAPLPIPIPGPEYGTAPPISPADARQALASRAMLAETLAPLSLAASETEATPEIVALARGLKNDPKLIYDFVHNYIDYVPTYGSVNGAAATLLARRGNDWDQASLFIALMRAAGYTANYKMGDVTYSVSRLANWVGTVNDINVVANVFANGGVPVAGVGDNLQITRVWAEAVIGGKAYVFDPAMKEYQDISGIANLSAAMGYSQTAFLNNARAGATVTADYVQSLNETNIGNDLKNYSTNLINYIRANLPNADLNGVIGGRRIVTTEMTSYATALPYALAVANQQAFATIGDAYRHRMRVQHAGIEVTLRTYQFAGQRMTVWYDGPGNAPVLRVDGTPVATGTATTVGAIYPMTITVDHPYAAGDGTFADQTRTMYLESGGQYAIMHTFNGASAELIAARNALLVRYRAQGLADDSEAVRGEALSLMGQMWLYEESLSAHILGRLGKVVPLTHHQVGIVGQEKSYFFDIPLAFVSDTTRDGVSSGRTVFRARTMMSSAFEHSVLEQLQGTTAVSTIRMLRESNVNGTNNKTFLVTSANWTGGANVRNQLVDYDAWTLADLDWYINNGFRLVLPQDGNIAVNDWSGNGYIAYYQSGSSMAMGMIINGSLGGFGTVTDTINAWEEITKTIPPPPDQIFEGDTPISGDPVNMLTGAFVFQSRDLAVDGAPPMGLEFTRYYNSGNRDVPGPSGYGWSHRYQISATPGTYGPYGLGVRHPVEGAGQIVWAYIALDLLNTDQPGILNWMVTDLATKWAADQLTNNITRVRLGDTFAEFVKAANGAYVWSGAAITLTVDGAGYHLIKPNGERIEFDPAGRATHWVASGGNYTTTLGYDGSGRLINVIDPFGRSLVFGYTGNHLTSVTHLTSTVYFTYTNGILTHFRDARGNLWQYEYDARNRLTRIHRLAPAAGVLFANEYDALGRVQRQADALGYITEFYWGIYRNTEHAFNQMEWVSYFDSNYLYLGNDD